MGSGYNWRECTVWMPFHRAFYKPQSMFDYVSVLIRPLIATGLDALIIETGIGINRVRRGVLYVALRDFMVRVPVDDVDTLRGVLRRYGQVTDALHKSLSNEVDQFSDLFNKAMCGCINEPDFVSLGYFFGDLQGEVEHFLKRINEYSTRQREELAVKYMGIAFQRAAARVAQRLAQGGAVLRDTGAPPNELRLLWIPQLGRGVYDLPNGKLQALSLLKSIMPGLIDFSNDESEYTRVARLALALNDDRDIDTLIELIVKAYLSPGNAALQRWWEGLGVPKKYIPLLLLSYALIMERGVFALIDFEGTTPITVAYPKILLTKGGSDG